MQFTELMENVDETLKKDGIPIHARSIRGWMLVCQLLEMSLPLNGKLIPNITPAIA
jgi:hypothetical protein